MQYNLSVRKSKFLGLRTSNAEWTTTKTPKELCILFGRNSADLSFLFDRIYRLDLRMDNAHANKYF